MKHSLGAQLRQIDTSPVACRRFSRWVGGVLVLIGMYGIRKQGVYGPWLGAAGLVLVGLGEIQPRWLRPFHWAWMALGLLLGRVVSPLVLGLLYYGVVTPIGLLARCFGRDFLQTRIRTELPSYWQTRPPESLPPRHDRQG